MKIQSIQSCTALHTCRVSDEFRDSKPIDQVLHDAKFVAWLQKTNSMLCRDKNIYCRPIHSIIAFDGAKHA